MINKTKTALVVSAHSADFVWRAGGAIALHAQQGYAVHIVCLSYGERGESAKLWRKGEMSEDKVKTARRSEAEAAAEILGASVEFFDIGDYPMRADKETLFRLADVFRRVQPEFVLSHSIKDPYNYDHPLAMNLTQEARIIAQAEGYKPGEKIVGPHPFTASNPTSRSNANGARMCCWTSPKSGTRNTPPSSAWLVRNISGSTTPVSPCNAVCRPNATWVSPLPVTSFTPRAIKASSQG